MGLGEEFTAELESSRPGVQCSVARALQALDEKDRKDLEEALARPHTSMPHSVISRVLTRTVGFKVPAEQVSKHRNGTCCGPR